MFGLASIHIKVERFPANMEPWNLYFEQGVQLPAGFSCSVTSLHIALENVLT